jgi:hypothetical protein
MIRVDHRKTDCIAFRNVDGVLFLARMLWESWSRSLIPAYATSRCALRALAQAPRSYYSTTDVSWASGPPFPPSPDGIELGDVLTPAHGIGQGQIIE